MTPKKARKLYKQVSEEMNLSETLVEDVVEFYYKAVRESMTNLVHPRINVTGLGYFVAKTRMIRKFIPHYTKALENHDTSTFKAYFNKKNVESKLKLLIEIEKKISEQELKKENIKQKRNESKS
jgi:nucleoid DNA-binding protein